MSTLTQFKNEISAELAAVRSKALAAVPSDIMYSALGAYIVFGCKVTGTTASPQDRTIWLSGQAAGDGAMLNPNLSLTPTRGFQYPNIASLADGAFRSLDTSVEVQAAPATGTARYDIAYIFVGPGGAGFAIVTGTPSSAVKTDYDTNGLDSSAYGEATITDPALPVGALPVARIYVEDVFVGVNAAQIADIRPLVAGASFGGVDAIRLAAEAARDLAQEWASNPENDAVTGSGSPQQYSAKHHAIKAAASAALAASSKDLAQEWASNAENTPVTGSGSPQQYSAKHHAIKAAASAALAAAIAASGLVAAITNGVVYLNSGGSLTTSSGLTFVPTAGLSVSGAGAIVGATLSDAASPGYFTINDTIASGGKIWRFGSTGAAGFGIFSIYNQTDNVLGLAATAAGKVGIGLPDPTEKLHVAGAIRATGAVTTNVTGGILSYEGSSTVVVGSWGADVSTYGAIRFYQANSSGTINRTGMLLDSAGNLGLTLTPSAWGAAGFLELPGARGISAQGSMRLFSNTYDNSGLKYIGTGTASYYIQETGQHLWAAAPSGTAGDAITFTEQMRLDASGNFSFGGAAISAAGNNAAGYRVFSLRGLATNRTGVIQLADSAGTLMGLMYANEVSGLVIDQQAARPIVFNVNGAAAATLTSAAFDVVSAKNENGIVVGPTTGTWAVDDFIGLGFRVRNTAGGAVGGNNLGSAIYGIQTNTGENTGGLSIRTRRDSSTFDEAVRWDSYGNQIQKVNGTAASLSANGTMTVELTSNTSLTFKVRGSDGTTRSGSITLS